MSKRIVVICSVVLMLVMLFGCGSPAASNPGAGTAAPNATSNPSGPSDPGTPAGPERSKIVNIAFSEKPRTMDPHNSTDQGSETAVRMCYETLIYSDHLGQGYHPMLAESWEIAPDGTYWTFKLRQGVTFNNGEPFDADDVVCTFERLIERGDELGQAMTQWADLESVEKIDQYTVRVNYTQPYPVAGNAYRGTYIIPNEAYEEYGDDLFNLQYMYGTGPWIMEEWVDGQYAHYTKNPNYWDKENYDPYFEEVYIRHVSEPSTAVAAHLTGDIDVYCPSGGIDHDLLPLYNGTEQTTEIFGMNTNFNMYMQFQMKEGSPWTDFDVRRAFNASIDRQLIIDAVLGGGKMPIGIYAEGVVGYDNTIDPYEYDPELARQLLADSSYDGREIELMSYPNMPKAEEVCLSIADMANQVGFNMTVKVEESGVFNTRRQTGEYDVFAGHVAFPDGMCYRQLNTNILNDVYKNNYKNEELFDAVRHYNTEMDDALRNGYAQQANRLIRDELAPQTVFAHLNVTYARNYGVVGVDFYPDGMFNFAKVDYDPADVR